MDIKAEFTHYCGPSVLFIAEHRQGHTLKITYTIPALDPIDHRFVIAHLSNGLEQVLRRAVRRAADHARQDAYRRTGHYAADMKHLLSGRTL
jgi:hypothetical protein